MGKTNCWLGAPQRRQPSLTAIAKAMAVEKLWRGKQSTQGGGGQKKMTSENKGQNLGGLSGSAVS